MSAALLAVLPFVARGQLRTHGNGELDSLFTADQSQRAAGVPRVLTDSVIQSLLEKDRLRQVRVGEIMAAGAAHTADDYYHAAMVYQHSRDRALVAQAHVWSRVALALDSTHAGARFLFAASWDRFLMESGLPQWYGTQRLQRPGQSIVLYDLDTTRVTDAERRRLGLPTLAEQRQGARSP